MAKNKVWYGTKAEVALLDAAKDVVTDYYCEQDEKEFKKLIGRLKGAIEKFYKSVGVTGWFVDRVKK